MNKPYTQLRFPTGHVYIVPTKVIEDDIKAKDSALPPDAHVLLGMTWADLSPHAMLVEYTPPAFDMAQATSKLVDFVTQPTAPNTGEGILSAPVELLASVAALSGNPFNSYLIQGPDGSPLMHVSLTSGPSSVIAAAFGGYQSFSAQARMLMQAASLEAVPAQPSVN